MIISKLGLSYVTITLLGSLVLDEERKIYRPKVLSCLPNHVFLNKWVADYHVEAITHAVIADFLLVLSAVASVCCAYTDAKHVENTVGKPFGNVKAE